jgi:aminoglycoside phosphotransferase family enzyme/predicted kinase
MHIQALLRPEAWPQSNVSLRLCETHISWVMLTGEYAYKIKKPVDFGFLDFSSLEKRRFYCEEEVRLNRRLAPTIYLDVVPVFGQLESPNMLGAGPVLDYAVRMRQFDTRQGYDQMLARDDLTVAHMTDTARTLAVFHQHTDIAEAESDYGSPAAVFAPVQENFDQIRKNLERQLADVDIREQFARLEYWSREAFLALEPVIASRREAGFVRECHGDLHLRNIIYWQGEVIPFDCLEFNPALRWIDVMSELAFLLMDLDDHGRGDLANSLLNAYLEITGDYEGLQLLRFYQVYRALVRAKVASLRLAQTSDGDSAAVEEISNYIRLASSYTHTEQARLLISHGLSGSGKTFVAQRILEQAPVIRLRSDVERKRLFALSESGQQGDIYQPETSALTYKHLLELAEKLLGWGYSVLVDAAFLESAQRSLFRDFTERQGISFKLMHCQVDAEIQQRRILSRQEEGRDASEAGLDVLEWQLKTQDELDDVESAECLPVDTSGDADLTEVLAWLNAGQKKAPV